MEKHLLLIVNQLSQKQCELVKSTLQTIAQTSSITKISLLYVRPYIAAHCYALPSMVDYLDSAENKAKSDLAFWGKQLNISLDDQWSAAGNTYAEAVRFINQFDVDYILADDSIKRSFNQKLHFHHRFEPSLIRSFSNLFLFAKHQQKMDQQWQHTALAHAML